MTSSARLLAAMIALCVGAAGCAALHAPVEFEPPSPPTQQQRDRRLRVEPVEGRPNGLVLRFSCACSPPSDALAADAWLEVLRRVGDAPAQVHRSVRLDEGLRARLLDEGIEFLDRSVEPTTMHYQLRLRASGDNTPADTLMVSTPLAVEWRTPPERPKGVRASSQIPGVVELHWEAPAASSALVFRRDVLDETATTQRIAQLGASADGVFVDRDVEPGGVYAYRVALALDTDTTVQFGRPSGEIYVTVQAAPDVTRQANSGI